MNIHEKISKKRCKLEQNEIEGQIKGQNENFIGRPG